MLEKSVAFEISLHDSEKNNAVFFANLSPSCGFSESQPKEDLTGHTMIASFRSLNSDKNIAIDIDGDGWRDIESTGSLEDFLSKAATGKADLNSYLNVLFEEIGRNGTPGAILNSF